MDIKESYKKFRELTFSTMCQIDDKTDIDKIQSILDDAFVELEIIVQNTKGL